MSDLSARTFDVRHLQLARAAFAAIAAIMITFSPDHSAAVGLAVFSGFAIATGLVHLLAVWLVHPAGERWPSVLLGILTLAAGMASGLPALRTTALFFAVVIAWALATGLVELLAGLRSRSRDAITVGGITLVLGAAVLAVPAQYALQYSIDETGESFTLTGITIAVGILGAYAAIVAVYLGIAGFSPRRPVPVTTEAPGADETSAGGAA